VLEGKVPSRQTQQHLDRCLTCRSCEAACPSGVAYGELVEIGRHLVDNAVPRPWPEATMRRLLRRGLLSPLFGPALWVGRQLRPLLPGAWRDKIPPSPRHHSHRAVSAQPPSSNPVAPASGARPRAVYLRGCVQPAIHPGIEAATRRVLARAGYQIVDGASGGCCGALAQHTGDPDGALVMARANIDAWWPWLQDGDPATRLVSDASACGLTVKEYGHALAHDPIYADKARRVSAACRDVGELVLERLPLLAGQVRPSSEPVVVHIPCTLQHGQRLPQLMDDVLSGLGVRVSDRAGERHLCCGSAGTYAVLQAPLSHALRTRKLQQLTTAARQANPPAQIIVSANVGCLTHLQAGTDLTVRHWIEVVDDLLIDAIQTVS
jgi:glycolate oxidase iron-sulfur subunit